MTFVYFITISTVMGHLFHLKLPPRLLMVFIGALLTLHVVLMYLGGRAMFDFDHWF